MRGSFFVGASRLALATTATLVLLWLADFVFQPVPAPAGGVAVGGVLAALLARRPRWRWGVVGVALGLTAGVAFHLFMHASGDSPAPEEGLFVHLIVDGLKGLAIGVVVMLLVVLPFRLFEAAVARPKCDAEMRRRPGL
jgi:hypothetical protein